ncbi:hypothetical protein TNCV_4075901 [Trichonephila clavipes]|nr:hypothetical protein TNCV_4075901 [Trichonephila clavipes]
MFTHLSLVTFSPSRSEVTTDIPLTLTMSSVSYPKGDWGNKRFCTKLSTSCSMSSLLLYSFCLYSSPNSKTDERLDVFVRIRKVTFNFSFILPSLELKQWMKVAGPGSAPKEA